jgi:hypothetical protein
MSTPEEPPRLCLPSRLNNERSPSVLELPNGRGAGHAIAHEMGRMLLSLMGHTPHGELLFTPYKAARMREEVKW